MVFCTGVIARQVLNLKLGIKMEKLEQPLGAGEG